MPSDPAALLARQRPLLAAPGAAVAACGTGGDSLSLSTGWADSPFGPALLFWSAQGLCGLAFDHPDRAEAEANMRRRWPAATIRSDAAGARALAAQAFSRTPPALHLIGTPFQRAVWIALLRVPYGALTTYGALAAALGLERSARAVGAAVGRNPVSWIVPCHRAMLGDGRIHAYEWGLARKRVMLDHEAAGVSGPAAPP